MLKWHEFDRFYLFASLYIIHGTSVSNAFVVCLTFPKVNFSLNKRVMFIQVVLSTASTTLCMLFVVDIIVIFVKELPFVHLHHFQQLVLNLNRYCYQTFGKVALLLFSQSKFPWENTSFHKYSSRYFNKTKSCFISYLLANGDPKCKRISYVHR